MVLDYRDDEIPIFIVLKDGLEAMKCVSITETSNISTAHNFVSYVHIYWSSNWILINAVYIKVYGTQEYSNSNLPIYKILKHTSY